MRYVLLFLFFSLLGAALIFNFSGSDSETEEDDYMAEKVETKPKAREVKKVVNEQDLESKAVSNFKEIKYLENETGINPKDNNDPKEPVNLKTATVIKNTPKSQMKKTIIKFKPVENPKKLVDSPSGDFFIQDHLKAVTPANYNKSMGEVLAKGTGYYFVNTDQPTNRFPVVVKKSGRNSLALLTGLISIKTKNKDLPARLKQTYNLMEVQAFSHLDLYIYKTNQVENLVSIYNSIKNESGVDSAELEILDKRVRKL